ncbi:hypothetical protein FRY77_21005 [Halomonas sp. MG34]|nr:hypothetical protein [Halomonas sp. MG34]
MKPSLFFILGNPRSGTSLLRLMLNSHPGILAPPECGFLLWLTDSYINNTVYSEESLLRFSKDVFNCRKFETWGVSERDILSQLLITRPCSYLELATSVYLAYAKKQKRSPSMIGDKNNHYIKEIEKINKFHPHAKKIFIIRDGRDVALSYLKISQSDLESKYRPQLPNAIEEIATEWNSTSLIIHEHEHDRNSCIVTYESLIQFPEKTLKKICRHLNISYSKKMLDFYTKNDEPTDFLQWKEKTKLPLDSSNLYKYEKEMTTKDIQHFEKRAVKYLKLFNYL